MYLIIESDGWLRGWGVVLKYRQIIFSIIKKEKISKYDNGTYQATVNATDVEIMIAIKIMH